MSKVLVTGGCGYIGSHTIVDLINNGFDVISVDNHNNSDPSVLDSIEEITGKKVRNYEVDLCNLAHTRRIFLENRDIAGIVHFAALKAVGESVEKPLLYYRNNLDSLLNILTCLEEFKVRHFIFSSSCSVYGNAKQLPVTEETKRQTAESPYARTKQVGEDIMQDFALVHPFANFISLRYFNPIGAHPTGLIGELPIGVPNNLVPYVTQTAAGVRQQLTVFGNDYNTSDGTCVRDYIHVVDLAKAHVAAIKQMENVQTARQFDIYNIGTGRGNSVLEVIHAFESATGQKLNYTIGNRRAGDIEKIYGDVNKAEKELLWKAELGIEEMMSSAWEWEKYINQNPL